MELSKIIASIEAGDGHEAWENLRVWYRRFLIFYRKNPKFFGGRRRRCWWEEIHKYDCVREIRKELLDEEYYECEKDKEIKRIKKSSDLVPVMREICHANPTSGATVNKTANGSALASSKG